MQAVADRVFGEGTSFATNTYLSDETMTAIDEKRGATEQ
jgi:hypothetical protein